MLLLSICLFRQVIKRGLRPLRIWMRVPNVARISMRRTVGQRALILVLVNFLRHSIFRIFENNHIALPLMIRIRILRRLIYVETIILIVILIILLDFLRHLRRRYLIIVKFPVVLQILGLLNLFNSRRLNFKAWRPYSRLLINLLCHLTRCIIVHVPDCPRCLVNIGIG